MGDVATNFFFQSMILYQTRFYTDTVGLSAVAVGTMFLVLRLADAVFDPAIGALADRTRTRWGSFRPWMLWTAVPFGLIFWLVYVTPDVGPAGKLIYAYLTYTLVMMLYSANNTPYSALMGVMTGDASERSSLASYRFVGALVGQFIIQALPLPLVAKFGGGDSARGWAVTMAIFGALIIVLNLITFASTRERVQSPPGERHPLSDDLKDVLTCRPWLVMFVLTLSVFTMLVVRGSSSNYFFAYYLDQQSIRALLASVGLAGLGRRGDGLEGRAGRARPAREAGQLQCVRRRPEPLLRRRQPGADRRHHRVEAAGGPLRQEGGLHRGRGGDDGGDGGRVPRRPDVRGPAVLAGHPVGRRLGPDGAAAVGDDRRRGGLLGVEDLAARDGVHVRGHPVRAEGGPEPGRRPERLGHRRLRLRAERRAVRARAAGHPARRERLSRPDARHRARLPGQLPDWQGARPADPGGAHRAPQALPAAEVTR